MGNLLDCIVLPALLLTAALIIRSFVSSLYLFSFIFVLYCVPKAEYILLNKILYCKIFVISLLLIFCQGAYLVISVFKGDLWIKDNIWWCNIVGAFIAESPYNSVFYYGLIVQISLAFVSWTLLYWKDFNPWPDSYCGRVVGLFERLGPRLRVSLCSVYPAIQLAAGITSPSWLSIPFFVGSCIGLASWSLTSNFVKLFRWWRIFQLYACLNIIILYVYQLPIKFSDTLDQIATLIGLFKLDELSWWPKPLSTLFLVMVFATLCLISSDLEEMEVTFFNEENDLTECLIQHRLVRQAHACSRGAFLRTININFFTYGFPVSLLTLSYWSFHFASFCALMLLVYVGYIIYASPSLFRMHHLNGLILMFILFWAVSTYIFNIAFPLFSRKATMDMSIWEMVGLWHYSIPTLFLFAQYLLGVLVALGNVVNNSVFHYLPNEFDQSFNERSYLEAENTKVFLVATIAWGLRKCSRAITLILIFLIATKPGFIHAIYVVFFMIYLLANDIGKRIRQYLILLCEIHCAILYILGIDLISQYLEQGPIVREILRQLGLMDVENTWAFIEIALLACVCAIHNHGFNMLFAFAAIVQHTPTPPLGFSILKAGLTKSILLTVYSSSTSREGDDSFSYESRIASFLADIGMRFLSVYRSCGTYIAFITILFTVYLISPNYISFGYIFLLLLWIIGRQLVEKTKQRLWYPLKAYAVLVFLFYYGLNTFPSVQRWLSRCIDLQHLGFNSNASLLENVLESLAVLVVMQLYSYERRQNRNIPSKEKVLLESGIFGFIKRFLVLHSHKLLLVTLFYASLSSISVTGLIYLLGLVIYSTLPKTSRVPSKLFLLYTGFLVAAEYLFQLCGMDCKMFPGQEHSSISLFVGLKLYGSGFWELESGLRTKVLVIGACSLQYNVFRWLDTMPSEYLPKGKWEEPCPLFLPNRWKAGSLNDTESSIPSDCFVPVERQEEHINSHLNSLLNNVTGGEKFSFESIWGSSKESKKWDKRRVLFLRKERFETQKGYLKANLKVCVENMFDLFGLEINIIAFLVAAFALLNVISMLFVALVGACILLSRRVTRKIWPIFVSFFACVLILEYVSIWRSLFPVNQFVITEATVRCHDCWCNTLTNFQHCQSCWLGISVDDPHILVSYYTVFILSCFKLRADRRASASGFSVCEPLFYRNHTFVWEDLSFDTKCIWTIFDYVRLYFFRNLLDLVLCLILITGTLEFDILHLGYLAFALGFFRMRLMILKRKNKIFNFLRIYNFVVISLSLAYQSPFFGISSLGKCESNNLYEIIGLYKYDYGFHVTSRSALVEIIIFVLVSLQSYMFSSSEFERFARYLEADHFGAIAREQEKKAAWKTEQLQYIRESEEKKIQRNLQVEKIKAETLNLRSELIGSNDNNSYALKSNGLRRRLSCLNPSSNGSGAVNTIGTAFGEQDTSVTKDSKLIFYCDHNDDSSVRSPETLTIPKNSDGCSVSEITEIREEFLAKEGLKNSELSNENPIASAVQLIGSGVSHVHLMGNQAVNNLVTFLNISEDDEDLNGAPCAEDGLFNEMERQNNDATLIYFSSHHSDGKMDATTSQIGKIARYMWSQMQANNNAMCYCCFVLVFLWNFSLLSMVYTATLYLYALCASSGPGYVFWLIMLVYTEIYILLQYVYQIIIQHSVLTFTSDILRELGFPTHKIASSFVISVFPLFLAYIFTLLQCFISSDDVEWLSNENSSYRGNAFIDKDAPQNTLWYRKAKSLVKDFSNMFKTFGLSFSGYWKSVIYGSESPPHFVQVFIGVHAWPDDGVQPETLESSINHHLKIVHNKKCDGNPHLCPRASRVNVQSIERSKINSNEALVVLEVVHASPQTSCTRPELSKSLTPAADVAKEIEQAPSAEFPYAILSAIGGGRRELDLYAYIFGSDLIVFFLVAAFYQSITKNKNDFLDVSQLEDQFPKEFVFVLMVIFLLIVVDRIIYLWSFAVAKVVFYIFNLVLLTFSVMKYAWTSQEHAAGLAVRAIFLAKAVSLALQATQIRYGIPHQSSLYQQFLTSHVSMVNHLGYRLYRAIPFLFELRCVLDWSCTTTSLTMYDWLKLEDIYASLYLVKCDAVLNRAAHRPGEKQPKSTKFFSGICLFFVLLIVIWAPMLIYSSGNPTNVANPIKDASVQVDITTAAGRLTLYRTTLCRKFSWSNLNSSLDLDPRNVVDAYSPDDVQMICCEEHSSSQWLLPRAVLQRFVLSLDADSDLNIVFSWVLTRDRPKTKEVVRYDRPVDPIYLPNPSDIRKVLNGSENSFSVRNLYPRYFRVTGSGEIRALDQESGGVGGNLTINRGDATWWSLRDLNQTRVEACGGLGGPTAVVVSEETPPQGIIGDTISKFSIWGLYITFVLAVGRFIRLQCSDLRMRIPYENLPSCDRLIAICEDIYAARAEGELPLEDVLYWTLIKIYRTPDLLFQYTKLD